MQEHEIAIPEPCRADWDSMRPQQRGRYCFECRKRVHDLSAMSEREATRFLDDVAERDDVCVSFMTDADGEVAFQPAPIVPVSRLRRLLPAAGLAIAAAACTPTEPAAPAASIAVTADVSIQTQTPTIPEAEAPPAGRPSVLAHPHQVVTVAAPDEAEAEPEPCDGSMSEPDPEPVVSAPPPVVKPPPHTRLAGRPTIRRKGGLKRRVPATPSPL